MHRFVLALSYYLMMLAAPIFAQDFNKGLEAAQSGDFETALKEWKPLAENGHSSAQNNLGLMYDDGTGVPQVDNEAAKWYTLAAEQGFVLAQYNLALLYENGRGVPQDYKEAIRLYKLAA